MDSRLPSQNRKTTSGDGNDRVKKSLKNESIVLHPFLYPLEEAASRSFTAAPG
jgi:hypothetical protein